MWKVSASASIASNLPIVNIKKNISTKASTSRKSNTPNEITS